MNIPDKTSLAGFTLLELTIVLALLAIVTHLAVIEAVKFRSKNLRQTANARLEEVRKAVLGPNLDCASGFVADMGRLPWSRETVSSARGKGLKSYDASELWSREDRVNHCALPAYTILDASLATNRTADSASINEALDKNVRVPCGWQGPYLRLPPGKEKLADAWGNLFETPDAAGATGRLLNVSSNAVTKGEEEIGFVQHFGSDGIPDSIAPPAENEEADYAVPFNVSTGKLSVCVEAYTADGNSFSLSAGNSFTLRLYSPAVEKIPPNHFVPRIRVQENQISTGTNSVLNAFSVSFDQVRPGPHVLAVKYSASSSVWIFNKAVAPLSEGSISFPSIQLRLIVP